MNTSQIVQAGGIIGAAGGITFSGTIGAPVVIAGILGCVLVGGICAGIGCLMVKDKGKIRLEKNNISIEGENEK